MHSPSVSSPSRATTTRRCSRRCCARARAICARCAAGCRRPSRATRSRAARYARARTRSRWCSRSAHRFAPRSAHERRISFETPTRAGAPTTSEAAMNEPGANAPETLRQSEGNMTETEAVRRSEQPQLARLLVGERRHARAEQPYREAVHSRALPAPYRRIVDRVGVVGRDGQRRLAAGDRVLRLLDLYSDGGRAQLLRLQIARELVGLHAQQREDARFVTLVVLERLFGGDRLALARRVDLAVVDAAREIAVERAAAPEQVVQPALVERRDVADRANAHAFEARLRLRADPP